MKNKKITLNKLPVTAIARTKRSFLSELMKGLLVFLKSVIDIEYAATRIAQCDSVVYKSATVFFKKP